MESKRNWYDISFCLCMIGMIQSLLTLPISILVYTGGTSADPNSPGFSMLYNFFSDLGRTIAYSGESNLISSLLFNTSLFFTGALLVPYFIALPKLLNGTRETHLLAVLGSVIGVFFASTFVGGALTPSDLFRDIHLMFGALAFVSGLPIVVFHSFAIFRTTSFPNRYAIVYIAFGLVLSSFLYAMYQAGTTELSLAVTIGQKFVVVSIMLCFLILSFAGRNLTRTANVFGVKN